MSKDDRSSDIVRRSQAGYFFLDREGCYQDVNGAWLRMHGYASPDEIIGRHFSVTQADAGLERAQQDFQRLLAGETIPPGEAPRKRKDSSIGHHSYALHAVREGDEIVGVEGFLIDTTDRRRLEDILQRGKRQWETAFDAMADWVSLIDPDGRVLRSNRAGEALLGIPVTEIVGKTCYNLVHNSSEPTPDCPLPYMLATRKRQTAEVQSATGRWLAITADPVFGPDGTITGAVHVAHDITDRRELDDALTQRVRELNALNALSRKSSASLSTDQVVQAIFDEIGSTVDPDVMMLYLCENDHLTLRQFEISNAPFDIEKARVHHFGECLCGLAASERTAVYSRDIQADMRCTLPECKEAGLRSFAALPLFRKGELLGLLALGSFAPQDFGGQADFLEALAGAAGSGLQNALLYEGMSESEDKFRTLAEQSPDMIFINKRGKVVYANCRCEEVMGYTREEFYAPGFHFMSLIAPEDAARVSASFQKHTAGQDVPQYQYSLVAKDGGRIEVLLSSRLIPYEGERAILGTVVDITERVRAEQERERLLAELQAALKEVRLLSGILPICASCKRIRDERGEWHQVEVYVRDHSEADFSHSICPDCARKLYPEYVD